MSERPYPRGLAHVGFTVPDIDAAVEWYRDVFGFNLVLGPLSVENEGFFGDQVTESDRDRAVRMGPDRG